MNTDTEVRRYINQSYSNRRISRSGGMIIELDGKPLPVETKQLDLGITEYRLPLTWLHDGDENVVFWVRDVFPSDESPVISNRPLARGSPLERRRTVLDPEVLIYDHERSKPLSNEILSKPIAQSIELRTADGQVVKPYIAHIGWSMMEGASQDTGAEQVVSQEDIQNLLLTNRLESV